MKLVSIVLAVVFSASIANAGRVIMEYNPERSAERAAENERIESQNEAENDSREPASEQEQPLFVDLENGETIVFGDDV